MTPYYNRPSPLGLKRHYEAVAAATDLPIMLYNIPARTGTNIGPELLAELAQIERHRGRQAGQRGRAGADRRSPAVRRRRQLARAHARHRRGGRRLRRQPHRRRARCGAWSTSPSSGPRSTPRCRTSTATLFLTSSPTCTKAALNLLGHHVGGVRLPIVQATAEELEEVRAMLVRHGLLEPAGATPSPTGAAARTQQHA